MIRVFVDTWYYVAFLDERDHHHGAVTRHAATLHKTHVTTRWVLAEVANTLCANRARPGVAAFLSRLEASRLVHVLDGSDELFDRGLRLYDRRPDKEWSLTDCISFVVMEDEGIREALTNDHHFTQAGYVAVFADAS